MSRHLQGAFALALLCTQHACKSPAPAPAADSAAIALSGDPLPSWRDGAAKTRIVEFVSHVTTEGGADFVPVAERIATFDNDGTLWTEKPAPFQLLFLIDRVKELAPSHADWQARQPFKGILTSDFKSVAATGERGVAELLFATHTGQTTDEFATAVQNWIGAARHPRFDRPYTDLIYQPQLELLRYLRSNGFKTYIVSGGTTDFMRPWVERTYGIPPEQVVGTTFKVKYEVQDSVPVLVTEPAIDFIDDKGGKPVAIHKFIGRRPIVAVGNSDGDYQMLEYTTAGPGPRLGIYIHHDDAEREYAYDRGDKLARLERGLDDAATRGWLLVSMKGDWKAIYPEVRSKK